MNLISIFKNSDVETAETAEYKIDLSGMKKDKALLALEEAMKLCKSRGFASIYVSFDPAKPGGGETLFQPVMRFFKVEKWNGYLDYATPLMTEEKGGVFAVFKK